MKVCPITDCKRELAPTFLMCAKHWFRVPITLRARIWLLFKSHPGSQEHREACFEAIERVEQWERAKTKEA